MAPGSVLAPGLVEFAGSIPEGGLSGAGG
jgi:hypothetical protein